MSRKNQFTPSIFVATVSALFLLAGCGKGNANGSGASAMAGSSASASTSGSTSDTARSASAASAGGSSGGEVAPSSDISQMSDTNIVAKLDAGDKGEVELARLMQTKATNDSVKAYAHVLVTDHSKAEKDVMSLEKQQKLVERPAQHDTTRQATVHVLQKFRAMPKGAALDSAFVQHEIEDHQHDIADAKAMANQAKNPELKQLIEQDIPVLQKHLDIAQRLSQQTQASGSK